MEAHIDNQGDKPKKKRRWHHAHVHPPKAQAKTDRGWCRPQRERFVDLVREMMRKYHK